MAVHDLSLEPEPELALRTLREVSGRHPVLVFKQSPICPASHRAEGELEAFLEALDGAHELALARIDVIAERALARGLTAELAVRHESPQALWFSGGELAWHGSHGVLTRECFEELLAQH